MVFRVTAEELSFTRAAHRLRMSVSAVSQRVRRLEQVVGSQLLDRTTTRVTLTDSGRAILAAAMTVEDTWRTTLAELAVRPEEDALGERLVRVGFLRAGHRNPLWSRLRAIAPDRVWEPRHYSITSSGFAELRRENLEFYLWSSWYTPKVAPAFELTGLPSVDIARDDVMVSLSERHPLADREWIAFDELAACDWVAPPAPEDQDLTTAICLDLGDFRPRFTHELDAYSDIMAVIGDTRAIDLSPPSSPPHPGVVRRTVRPAPTSRYALTWRHDPEVARLAAEVVAVVRHRYAEKTREWNPAHWAHIEAHPLAYPGIVR
ncbi:LysR family transcriptional regulator [Micromonospora sp. NPDC000089]|uniref:LysR family transcriptional regulator n=1 Tax=unclassified Micromonospora TaxID=2617518 RepID=UPI0036A1862E